MSKGSGFIQQTSGASYNVIPRYYSRVAFHSNVDRLS
jgi:hypothetical protein